MRQVTTVHGSHRTGLPFAHSDEKRYAGTLVSPLAGAGVGATSAATASTAAASAMATRRCRDLPSGAGASIVASPMPPSTWRRPAPRAEPIRWGHSSHATSARFPYLQLPQGARGLTSLTADDIVRHVPKYHDEVDVVLRALADPTRRAVVQRLSASPAVVSELAAPFAMALPSFLQHLGVLEDAGLVTSEKHGRVRTVSLRPGALDVLHLWLGEQRTPAERQADRLGIHLTRTAAKGT